MEQKISRPRTVAAVILNIFCAIATLILVIITMCTTNTADVTAAFVMLIIVSFLVLVFSIILLCFADRANYPKGFAITLFVFDVYLAFAFFYCLIMVLDKKFIEIANTGPLIITMLSIFLVANIISAVFMMADIVKFRKLKTKMPSSNLSSGDTGIMGKIIQLKQMKDEGIITEKEFKDLKKNLLENF